MHLSYFRSDVDGRSTFILYAETYVASSSVPIQDFVDHRQKTLHLTPQSIINVIYQVINVGFVRRK